MGARGAGLIGQPRRARSGGATRGRSSAGTRALALAVGSAEPGFAGGHVIGATRLVVQLTGVTQVRDSRAGPIECEQCVADVLLAVGDCEIAVQRGVRAACRLEPRQCLVLPAEPREHDAEAVVADRDVARAIVRLQHRSRLCEAIERLVELARLRQRDADLAVTGGRCAQVSLGRVCVAVVLELFDAAQCVGHGRGRRSAPVYLTIAEKS